VGFLVEIRKESLARLMIETGVVAFGEFVLTSGMKSPVYVDMRRALGNVELRTLTIELAVKVLKELDFDAIVGVATGGVPWASIIAHRMRKPFAYIREARKEHGMGKRIEGAVGNYRYLIIDDVATTGGSLEYACQAVREAGGTATHAFVLVDRGQGAHERLKSVGLDLTWILTLREIVDIGLKLGMIDEGLVRRIYNYMGW